MTDQHNQNIVAKPFLRWAGGKSRLVNHLLKYAPTEYRNYREPFLGAGAMFFTLAPSKANLSDSNEDLIACYEYVRDQPDLVFRYLKEHLDNNSEKYYYSVRAIYNRSGPSTAQAARFIYLNKTSFNGIFRVNTKGEYNVPYGFKEPPALPSLEELREASEQLTGAKLAARSFEIALGSEAIQHGDFIYLDPPYPPLGATANFTHYTSSRFSWEDQERVAKVANRLRDRKCYVMISNSDVDRVRALYKDWHIHTLPVVRWIAANGTRHRVRELVITNYSVETRKED